MKDSFIVRLAVSLGFKALALDVPALSWLFVGPFSAVTSYFATRFLGYLADQGILAMDLTWTSIKVGLEQSEYHDAIEKAYAHATARVYTEEEKNAIRQEYLDALRKFATVGDGVQSERNSS